MKYQKAMLLNYFRTNILNRSISVSDCIQFPFFSLHSRKKRFSKKIVKCGKFFNRRT